MNNSIKIISDTHDEMVLEADLFQVGKKNPGGLLFSKAAVENLISQCEKRLNYVFYIDPTVDVIFFNLKDVVGEILSIKNNNNIVSITVKLVNTEKSIMCKPYIRKLSTNPQMASLVNVNFGIKGLGTDPGGSVHDDFIFTGALLSFITTPVLPTQTAQSHSNSPYRPT